MTHYDLLAVPRDASLETIRASFQTQMSQWASSSDPSAEQRRHQIQSAYVVLSDPELRATYDARLANQAREQSPALSSATRIPSADEIAAYDKQPAGVLALDAFRDQRWAGFWLRFGAQFIDSMILYIPGMLAIGMVAGILLALHTIPAVSIAIAYMTYGLVFALYNGWLNSSASLGTVGRRAAGLAVVSASDGEQIGFAHAFGRGILSFFSALLVFPDLLQLFTDRRQSFADMIAGTVVVRKRAGGSPAIIVVVVVCLFGGVALIGILAAIAIPAYQDYTVRARVTLALTTARSYESLVEQNAYSRANDLSTGFVAPDAPAGRARIAISRAGIITVNAPGPVGKTVAVSLYPSWAANQMPAATVAPANSAITWECRVDAVTNDRYVPTECRV